MVESVNARAALAKLNQLLIATTALLNGLAQPGTLPLQGDPILLAEYQRLDPSDSTSGQNFARALAVDGDTLVIGAVYVFEFVGPGWSETARLVASDAAIGDALGQSVGIDGDLLLAGSSNDADVELDAGAVYAFRRSRGSWLEAAKLHADDRTPSAVPLFGTALDLSHGNGFVGAYQEPPSGAAYAFGLPFNFSPYCFGDGSGSSCPCGNPSDPDAQAGCDNSFGVGGALAAGGTSRVSADDLVLMSSHLVPDSPAPGFVADNAIAGGAVSWGPGLAGLGGWRSGDTRYFQVWYRDPSFGPCGSGFREWSSVSLH